MTITKELLVNHNVSEEQSSEIISLLCDPKRISIRFVAEKDPDIQSSIIMKDQGTDYSHVLLSYFDGYSERIFHATGDGVHTLDYDKYMETHVSIHDYSFVVSYTNFQRFLGFVMGSDGKKYGYGQLLGIKLDKEVSDNDNEKMICCELAGLVARDFCGVSKDLFNNLGDQDTWDLIEVKKILDTSDARPF